MATGATSKAFHRRFIDIGARSTNDHPRKKRKRGNEQTLRDDIGLEAERFPLYVARRPYDVGPDPVLVRVFSRWIRDPLCRRVVSSQLGSQRFRGSLQSELGVSRSPSLTAKTTPSSPPAFRSLPSVQKRFPSVEDEEFVNYETLKSYVNEMSPKESAKVLLVDGDRVEIVHKSLGEAFEIRKSAKAEEVPTGETLDGRESASSFELISESFNQYEEAIYPPPLQRPLLGPFHLKIPAPLPLPPPPPTVPPEVACRHCPEEDSVCFSCEESDDASACEWRSDSTSEVELSFVTDSLIVETSGVGEARGDEAAKWMVDRFKKRLEVNRLSSFSREEINVSSLTVGGEESKNPYCAVPLRVLRRGNTESPETCSTLKKDICKLAYVEELISSKAHETSRKGAEGGGWLRSKSSASEWNPFLCEGKILSLAVDDGLSTVEGCESSSKGPKSSEFLVTPRFDMTLEEHLAQSYDLSEENRLLLFLQCLEAVASLHTRDLAHGSVAASNFFLDLHQDGRHRILLSDFSKIGNLTEDRKKLDSWQLGRLGLRLFDDDIDEESVGTSGEDVSVDDLPVLNADAPLEIDILVHSLMSNDSNRRVSPTIAANMLHLYFWRNNFRSALTETMENASTPTCTTSQGLSSQRFQTAKKETLKSFGSREQLYAGGHEDDVQLDLRRSLFRRASFDDILHADEMWKRSRGDLAKYAVTGDDRHAELFVESRS